MTNTVENPQLKGRIENFLPYQIDYTSNFNKSFRRIFQDEYITKDISPDEFGILYLLNDFPEISQTDIAKFLFRGKAHVGKILNEMEQKGLIKRSVNAKQNILLKKNEMTQKGLELFHYGEEKAKIIGESMNKEFTKEEKEQFIQYLIRFRRVLASIVDVEMK